MFGFDSLSRNAVIRQLPKSFKYLKEDLQADILEGYNIVGDGTPAALTPMFTGKTEWELPIVDRIRKPSSYVNVYPFIWNKFKSKGYVTGYAEDEQNFGTYQYRLNGFKVYKIFDY